jgi:hypothetical protein
MRSLLLVFILSFVLVGCSTRTIVQECEYIVPQFPIEHYEYPEVLELDLYVDDEENMILMDKDEYVLKLRPYLINLKENHILLINEIKKFNEMNKVNEINLKGN